MGTTALAGLPAEAEPRDQLLHMWPRWLRWATTHPDKRRAPARPTVAE